MDTRSYLLGMFDGEGSIQVSKDGDRWGLSIIVGMAERRIVTMFAEEWGGRLYTDSIITAGGLSIHRWVIAGSPSLPFLRFVSQHSLVKGKQAALCLPLAESMGRMADPAWRKGVNVKAGGRGISLEEAEARAQLRDKLRSMKSDGSRYGPSDQWIDDGTIDHQSYVMGLFDGEGCVATRQKDRSWILNIAITMASEPAVRRCMDVWGGGVSKRTARTVGGLELWAWQVSGANAGPFLEYAATHSLTKCDQLIYASALAQNMVKYARRGGVKNGRASVPRFIADDDLIERERLALAIRALNGARSRFGASREPDAKEISV